MKKLNILVACPGPIPMAGVGFEHLKIHLQKGQLCPSFPSFALCSYNKQHRTLHELTLVGSEALRIRYSSPNKTLLCGMIALREGACVCVCQNVVGAFNVMFSSFDQVVKCHPFIKSLEMIYNKVALIGIRKTSEIKVTAT